MTIERVEQINLTETAKRNITTINDVMKVLQKDCRTTVEALATCQMVAAWLCHQFDVPHETAHQILKHAFDVVKANFEPQLSLL